MLGPIIQPMRASLALPVTLLSLAVVMIRPAAAQTVLLNEVIDFSSGTIPAGWGASPMNYGSGDFAGGRMNAYTTDALFGITTNFSAPAGLGLLALSFDANLSANATSMAAKLFVQTNDSRFYEFALFAGSFWGANMHTRISFTGPTFGSNYTELALGTLLAEPGTYRVTAMLQDGSVTLQAQRLSDSTTFPIATANIPSFALGGITALTFAPQVTTGTSGWIDNVAIQGFTAVPEPSTYMMLAIGGAVIGWWRRRK